MALLTSHFRFGRRPGDRVPGVAGKPFTVCDQPLPSERPGVDRTGQYANRELGELLAPTLAL